MKVDVYIYPASSRYIGEVAASVLLIYRGGAQDGMRVSDIHIFRPCIDEVGYRIASKSIGGFEHAPLGRAIVEAFRAGTLKVTLDLHTATEAVAA